VVDRDGGGLDFRCLLGDLRLRFEVRGLSATHPIRSVLGNLRTMSGETPRKFNTCTFLNTAKERHLYSKLAHMRGC
jgi:hypothetical protein